ncbi:hypothetical protein K438DRAFT_1943939, partial [Mycena galopus ATCC 62051]
MSYASACPSLPLEGFSAPERPEEECSEEEGGNLWEQREILSLREHEALDGAVVVRCPISVPSFRTPGSPVLLPSPRHDALRTTPPQQLTSAGIMRNVAYEVGIVLARRWTASFALQPRPRRLPSATPAITPASPTGFERHRRANMAVALPLPAHNLAPLRPSRTYTEASTQSLPTTASGAAIDATPPPRSFRHAEIATSYMPDELRTTYGVILDPFAPSLARLLPLDVTREHRRLTYLIGLLSSRNISPTQHVYLNALAEIFRPRQDPSYGGSLALRLNPIYNLFPHWWRRECFMSPFFHGINIGKMAHTKTSERYCALPRLASGRNPRICRRHFATAASMAMQVRARLHPQAIMIALMLDALYPAAAPVSPSLLLIADLSKLVRPIAFGVFPSATSLCYFTGSAHSNLLRDRAIVTAPGTTFKLKKPTGRHASRASGGDLIWDDS